MTISRIEASVVLAAITVAQENPTLFNRPKTRRLLAVRATELLTELQHDTGPDWDDPSILNQLRWSLVENTSAPSLPTDQILLAGT